MNSVLKLSDTSTYFQQNCRCCESPLLSLMQDHAMSLQQRGIKAEYLGSTQTNKSISTNAKKGFFDILYMTPEKACSHSERFWTNLLEAGICLLAVDEAHCISEWGHDFRFGIAFCNLYS